RACTWATVRLTPQRVPISPQWRINLRMTGVRVIISFCTFCYYRIYRSHWRLSRAFYAGRPRPGTQKDNARGNRAADRGGRMACALKKGPASGDNESEITLEELRDGDFGPALKERPKILVRLLHLHDAHRARR